MQADAVRRAAREVELADETYTRGQAAIHLSVSKKFDALILVVWI